MDKGKQAFSGRLLPMASPAMRTSGMTMRDDGILLHIGPHKTGTTAIQGSLAANRRYLRRSHGILFPGAGESQHAAAKVAIGQPLGWDFAALERIPWLQLRCRAATHRRRVVLSSEVFCEASAAAAENVVNQLGRNRVQVAITLRPLEQLLASTWQQYVKAGVRMRYDSWLTAVLESRDQRSTTPSFWIRNNHADLVRRWAAVVGRQNVVIVIVDAGDPRALFDAFEDLLALPRHTLNRGGKGPSNRSLSLPEVELLRRFNRVARPDVERADYVRVVKNGAVRQLVESRVPGPRERQVTTPRWAIERAREFSRMDVAQIATMGVHCIGELACLAPQQPLPDDADTMRSRTVPVQLAADFAFGVLKTSLAERDRPIPRLLRRLVGRH